jgi:hypothetical protein
MREDDIDAELVSFLHDLPEGAAVAIEHMVSAAATAGAKRASRSGWIRLLIQSAMLGAAVLGAAVKYGDVATKEDIAALEKQYTLVLDSRSSQNETQNNRISVIEVKCQSALECCAHQTNRIDLITAPRRGAPND